MNKINVNKHTGVLSNEVLSERAINLMKKMNFFEDVKIIDSRQFVICGKNVLNGGFENTVIRQEEIMEKFSELRSVYKLKDHIRPLFNDVLHQQTLKGKKKFW
mgnify:CR=1 FL=1